MKRNRKDYDKYISIIDETINVNWNFREQYEKIVYEIIAEYEKEKNESSNNERGDDVKEQLIKVIEASEDEQLIRRLFALVSGYKNQKQKELSQDETTL